MTKQTKKIKSIHFVGIKGVGMTPLAIIAKEAGIQVTGSDVAEEFITDISLQKAGIKPVIGFSENHIDNVDLVITTGAHGGFDNVEVASAKKKNIPVLTKGEAVGKYMDGTVLGRAFQGIAVAGSHGKTTTSAMIATILKETKEDPSYLIGTSEIPSLGISGHFGKGKYFVAEADEYATEPAYDKTPQFWHMRPQFAIFTNIELDHPDMYESVDDVRDAFLKFAENISSSGALIACGDDGHIQKMIKQYKGRVVTYGFSPQNTYCLKRVSISGPQMFFWVESKGVSLGEFRLRVVGEHNALNALASIALSLELGLTAEQVKKGLLAFLGTKRRFEYLGELETGALVYDDYAHHPTEIKKTLQALRALYPKKHLIVIFQPHTYSRTKRLFSDFLSAFSDADTVIITDIFASAREQIDETVSSKMLIDRMKITHRNALHIGERRDVVQYIDLKRFGSDTVIILMGAGNIYHIAKKLPIEKK